MGGPTQVLVSYWSAESSNTPIPESGRGKSDSTPSVVPPVPQEDCFEHLFLIDAALVNLLGE